MPKPFHSINESAKPFAERVYHDCESCIPGQDIPHNKRREGKGDYRLCNVCFDFIALGKR